MATFTGSDDLQGAQFLDANLQGAQFVRSDLSGAVMRGVDMAGADIDAPWLLEGKDFLRVNGVDVPPFVDAELNRRFPGRVAMVREYLAIITADDLATARRHPDDPGYQETTLSCLHTILM